MMSAVHQRKCLGRNNYTSLGHFEASSDFEESDVLLKVCLQCSA